MRYRLTWFKNYCYSLATLTIYMTNTWDKGKIFIMSPLELNNLISIILYGKIQSFFFIDNTISKIYLIFLFKGQIFKQNLLIIGLTLNLKSHNLELIQLSNSWYLPYLNSYIFWLELDIKHPIAFRTQSNRVIINKLKVFIGSQLKFSCRRYTAIIFQRNRLSTSLAQSCLRKLKQQSSFISILLGLVNF